MWGVQWRGGPAVPDKFQVSRSTSRSILHSIEGLDPHKPCFLSKQCYHWKLWSCLKVGHDNRLHIRTPTNGEHGKCTQNLRFLLMYHYSGTAPDIVTSSKKQCPCNSGTTYGECCFPTVLSTCQDFTGFDNCGLCVNPLHMRWGRAADDLKPKTEAKCRPNPHMSACASCATCGWSPQEFYISNRVRGVHPTACQYPLSLSDMGKVRDTLDTWKVEGLKHQMQTCSRDDAECIERYMHRYCVNGKHTGT